MARIRAEEIYRVEIRQRLSAANGSRIWKFLNSAFGLWLLGSVTLTGVTWQYQRLVAHRQEVTQQDELRKTLRREIIYRARMTTFLIDVYKQNKTEAHHDPDANLNGLVRSSMNGETFLGHIEYRDVPTSALLFRLKDLPNPEHYELNNASESWMVTEVQLAQRSIETDELGQRVKTIFLNLNTPTASRRN